jgi:8-oxo-dGTP pyrophosphatase MutT (NUDIX family)
MFLVASKFGKIVPAARQHGALSLRQSSHAPHLETQRHRRRGHGARRPLSAGHWESGETLPDACAREALEETGHRFRPTSLIGVYRWRHAAKDITFLRFTFVGELLGEEKGRVLDKEIRRVLWLTPDEIRALAPRHRSPLVMACIEDCLAGRRYPLELLRHFA